MLSSERVLNVHNRCLNTGWRYGNNEIDAWHSRGMLHASELSLLLPIGA